jgi:hypothetical protein
MDIGGGVVVVVAGVPAPAEHAFLLCAYFLASA